MSDISQELLEKISKASSLLQEVLEAIQSPKPKLLPEVRAIVQELFARGYCLNGDHEIVPDNNPNNRPTRGMCKTHYNHWYHRCSTEDGLSADLMVARGLWVPEGIRKSKPRISTMTSKQLVQRRAELTLHLYREDEEVPGATDLPGATANVDELLRDAHSRIKPKEEK